ncbi:C45 family autoproteolytic acyltransferase/hydolase [Mesorhizobium xinjiangense]|uniref:C45 family autoproteolytic acyltransferase/hydolase n=1 Tax=Mesorhizobium xinjiangense TaxID=2678685 RepID=UPI0012EE9AD8|nr:C45 family peptidase [Mesorhizobium xinjiangense]
MTKPTASPLIEVSGSPIERGRQYGEQARERVKRGIDHYVEQLARKSIGWEQVARIAEEFEPTIAGFDPAYVEEMKGIAEGASVDPATIVLLNARTEILKLAERRGDGMSADKDEPDGCTSVAVLPRATRDGDLIHAQNWDWKAECAETTVVLRVRRDDGPDFLTFTEAGALARCGMNAAGVSIAANYLESDRDYRNLAVPLPFIRRKVLEKARVGEAMHTVYTTAKSCANNMMVAHANGVVIDFECAPDETFQVLPKDGLLCHANHFVSPVALSKLRDRGIRNMPDSLYRDLRVRELLVPHLGAVTRDHVIESLRDDFETPWSVCRPPRPSMVNNLTATVAMVVMEPAKGRMSVAMLPALYPEFTTYELDMEIAAPDTDRAPATFVN